MFIVYTVQQTKITFKKKLLFFCTYKYNIQNKTLVLVILTFVTIF